MAPWAIDATRSTLLIVFATPNGNTIEQSLGAEMTPGKNWHFDIQHIAAQTRVFRKRMPQTNIVLACAEAEGLSWPSWRATHANASDLVRSLVLSLRDMTPGKRIDVALTGHSGGGSFLFAFVNSSTDIPDWVSDIAFLDANYSYSDAEGHGDKLIRWLKESARHRLVVIAYDDRNIKINGKKVVSATGGTYRASMRMLRRFEGDADLRLQALSQGPFAHSEALNGQLQMFVHANPDNKILHTALVGEMNGFLQAMTVGTGLEAEWGVFGGPRAYGSFVSPGAPDAPCIPSGSPDAAGGSAVFASFAGKSQAEYESAILAQIAEGNVPSFCRNFQPVTYVARDARGREHEVTLEAMSDYLSVGNDSDFVRVCLTPMSAQQIADLFDCILPTTRLSDIIWQNAVRKVVPHPLTQDREALVTIVQHSRIVDGQLVGTDSRLLSAGQKKDIVISNILKQKPHKVAIYGWHRPNGVPIQPLTNIHRDTYVDYSHGTRLIQRRALIDREPADLADIYSDPILSPLVSDEGPITTPRYTQPSIAAFQPPIQR